MHRDITINPVLNDSVLSQFFIPGRVAFMLSLSYENMLVYTIIKKVWLIEIITIPLYDYIW